MSRGGRGGGRGGRGGGRGGRPALPWEDADEPDARPSDLFPPYAVPTPRDLTSIEESSVQYFLLLRHQIHSSPLYTSKRTSLTDPSAPRKAYGRAQMNALFDVKSKASLDPFTAVPMYSQRFSRQERALPDWAARPVCREMYPVELLDTVDAADGAPGARKKRRLELSKVNALPNAEEAFGITATAAADESGFDDDGADVDVDADAAAATSSGARSAAADGGKSILEKLDALKDDDGEEVGDLDDEEGLEEEEDEDEIYDDEDAGDYDAEGYFDNGDEGGDDYGDDGDGEGTF